MKSRILGWLLIAAVLAGTGAAQVLAATRDSAQGKGESPWISLARGFSSVVPPSLIRLFEGGQDVSTGNDGRLTILLLGSDSRGGGIQRTDTVMVASLKGNSISVASIPRDTARIPNPNGGTFTQRINAILKYLKQGRTTAQAFEEFKRVVENLLQIEIDYYALVSFPSFDALVREVEPISIRVNKEVRDTKFWDDPNEISGVYFPQASDYELYTLQPGSNPLCNGLWRNQSSPIPNQYWCHRALPFVRTRKGANNSDFARARRQQDFVFAGVRRVLNRGSGGNLTSLLNVASHQKDAGTLYTDIPMNLANAMDMFNRLDGADVDFQVVFAPTQYATHIPGGTAYQLKLAEVHSVMKQWFGSTGNPPPPPPPTPTPNATPTLPGFPTPTPTRRPTATPTIPGVPTSAPTIAPVATPTTPGSTLLPTFAPSETPSPIASLEPAATPTPTAIAALPSGSVVPGAVITPVPGTPTYGAAPAGQDSSYVLVAAVIALLVGAGILTFGWIKFRPKA